MKIYHYIRLLKQIKLYVLDFIGGTQINEDIYEAFGEKYNETCNK